MTLGRGGNAPVGLLEEPVCMVLEPHRVVGGQHVDLLAAVLGLHKDNVGALQRKQALYLRQRGSPSAFTHGRRAH